MHVVWLCVTAFCATWLEILVGTAGLPLPVLAATAFYLTAVFGWRPMLVPALACGTALDLAFGHVGPTAVLALVLVMALAGFWRRQGDCRSLPLQAVPGALVGIAYGGVLILCGKALSGPLSLGLLLHSVLMLLGVLVLGAGLQPLLCHALDRLALQLHLPRYLEIQRSGVQPRVR
jgi:hypothetical protein